MMKTPQRRLHLSSGHAESKAERVSENLLPPPEAYPSLTVCNMPVSRINLSLLNCLS